MATIVVSFRPLSRNRYQPRVWRGLYDGEHVFDSEGNIEFPAPKRWELFNPIKKDQLDGFRNRFAPRRPTVKKPKVHSPQRPAWMQGRSLFSKAYEAVVCQGCRQEIHVPYDAKKVTCGKCGDITPIKRDWL